MKTNIFCVLFITLGLTEIATAQPIPKANKFSTLCERTIFADANVMEEGFIVIPIDKEKTVCTVYSKVNMALNLLSLGDLNEVCIQEGGNGFTYILIKQVEPDDSNSSDFKVKMSVSCSIPNEVAMSHGG